MRSALVVALSLLPGELPVRVLEATIGASMPCRGGDVVSMLFPRGRDSDSLVERSAPARPALELDDREATVVLAALAHASLSRGSEGIAGSPPKGPPLAEQLARIVSADDLARLAGDGRVSVRAWAADALVRTHPERANDIAHLLEDPSTGSRLDGCFFSALAVEDFVLEALCDQNAEPAVATLLVSAGRNPDLQPGVRRRALVCAAAVCRPETVPLARQLLRSDEAVDLPEAILALAAAANVAALPELAPFVDSDDLKIRRTVARALSLMDAPECLPHLEKLRFDPDRTTQETAIRALAKNPGRDVEDVKALLFRGSSTEMHATALGIADRPDEATLGLLLSALSSGNGAVYTVVAMMAWSDETPAMSAFFRALLQGSSAQDRAFYYFGHVQDPEVLPFARDALRAGGDRDRRAAIYAAVQLHDVESIPALEALLEASDGGLVHEAAKALVDLESHSSRAAIERAATRMPSLLELAETLDE